MTPEALGIAGAAFAALAYPPYALSTLKRRTKPHAFSWFLWMTLTWIAFAIQVVSGAGAGAWATFVSAFSATVIAALSLKYGEKNITRSDWIAFLAGVAAIPLWIVTKDPTASAILVTMIDCFGFYPTFRKSWVNPHEEMLRTHVLSLFKHGLSIMAMAVYSIPTAFYPAALFVMNVVLVGIIGSRRLVAKRKSLNGGGEGITHI